VHKTAGLGLPFSLLLLEKLGSIKHQPNWLKPIPFSATKNYNEGYDNRRFSTPSSCNKTSASAWPICNCTPAHPRFIVGFAK
jgi:hypothetical protein